jgi:hypothetical protein
VNSQNKAAFSAVQAIFNDNSVSHRTTCYLLREVAEYIQELIDALHPGEEAELWHADEDEED